MSSVLGISLPQTWSASPLKHVTTLLNRGSAPNYVDDGSVRAISQAANQDAGLDWSRTRFHEFEGDARKIKGYLLPSDILINSTGTGTLGRIGYFAGSVDEIPCIADSHVTVARAKSNELYPRFGYYWLKSQPFQDYVYAALIVGATNQIELNRDRLGDAPVPVPQLQEQRRIADFLDAETARVDRMVEMTRRQVYALDEWLIEGLRRATTVGDSVEVRQTGVSWMPEMAVDWDLWRIGHAFSTGSGTTPSSGIADYFDGDHYWVNTGDLRDGVVQAPMKTVTDKALADYTTLKIYPVDSLVVAMYGATTGRVGVLGVPACVNQACCVLSEIGNVSSQYAFLWFRAHREEILRLASGGGQPNISQDLVRNLRIPAPSRERQEHVVRKAREKVQAVLARQDLLRRRGALLAERRQALITAAVTGQIDVSTASGRGIGE